MPPGDILRYEEILRLIRVGASLGIRKVRITGGEPLVRRGISGFVAAVGSVEGIIDCCLTTNGVLLREAARDLKEAGLSRVTVSLDSLQKERFEQITGRDALGRVLDGIDTALAEGLSPVKINVVVIRGTNDGEVVDFARMTMNRPLEVRFIERMPLGKREETRGCGLWEREGVPGDEIRRRIEATLGPLETASPSVPLPGPARLYRVPGSPGRIGLITPMTHPFCHACTRLRLTPDGRLRSCLFRATEIDLRRSLRSGDPDDRLRKAFEEAIRAKSGNRGDLSRSSDRWMVQIGG